MLAKIFGCCVAVMGCATLVQALDYNSSNSPYDSSSKQDSNYYYQGSQDRSSQDKNTKNGDYDHLKKSREQQNRIHNPAINKPNYLSYNNSNGAVTTSDQELTKRIKDKIGSGWFSRGYEQVTVDVQNGVVTLGGSVKTEREKEKVEREVRDLEGVKKLNSQISVREPSGKVHPREFSGDTASNSADEQLNKKIRDKVSRGWFWDDHKDVSLSTSNGVVTLNGSIEDREDEQELVGEIQKVEGVKSVKSNLRIENNNNH